MRKKAILYIALCTLLVLPLISSAGCASMSAGAESVYVPVAIDVRGQLDEAAAQLFEQFQAGGIERPEVKYASLVSGMTMADGYAGFGEYLRESHDEIENSGLPDGVMDAILHTPYTDNISSIAAMASIENGLVPVGASFVLPSDIWQGGVFVSTAYIEGSGDVCTAYAFRPDQYGAIGVTLSSSADIDRMVSWVSLYDLDLSEFTACEFYGIAGGIGASEFDFDGLDAGHAYALFVSAAAGTGAENGLTVRLQVGSEALLQLP
jgi:hypothetical protein